MTAEQFKKYEGKRTTGRVYGHDLSGGILVGYTNDSFPNELLAIDSNSGWTGPHWSNEAIITNKEYENDYLSGLKNYLWVTVDNVIMDEQKEFDLTKILKGCEGMVFYSTMVGYCRLIEVTEFITIGYDDDRYVTLESDGKFSEDGECTVFPSKENRDWSTFKKPVKVRDDDWVACCESIEGGFVVCRYGKLITDWKYIIPYDEFRPDLTEEDLKKLSIV